jgi:hypothetical protein
MALASSAEAANVDWKMYGSVLEHQEICFYDLAGVAFSPNSGNLQIWTKCIETKEIDKIDIAKDYEGRILKSAAEKTVHGYVPPIIRQIQTLNFDQMITITYQEEIANISGIQPRSRILYELNCGERMIRELDIYVEANGKVGSSHTPSSWKHVPPETNGTRLLKMLCATD